MTRKELLRELILQSFTKGMTPAHYNGMVDFIIEDRKRIINYTFLRVEEILMRYRDSCKAAIKVSEGRKDLINELSASALNIQHCLSDIEYVHKKINAGINEH